MPCYDSRNDPEYVRNDEADKWRARNDLLARMLCALCRVSPVSVIGTIPNLPEWWAQHQIEDAERGEE